MCSPSIQIRVDKMWEIAMNVQLSLHTLVKWVLGVEDRVSHSLGCGNDKADGFSPQGAAGCERQCARLGRQIQEIQHPHCCNCCNPREFMNKLCFSTLKLFSDRFVDGESS